MKKHIIIIASVIFGFIGFSFAYTPSTTDQSTLTQLKTQIDSITKWDTKVMRKLTDQLQNLQTRFPNQEKLNYLLSGLETHLSNQINTQKAEVKQANKEQIKIIIAKSDQSSRILASTWQES